MDEDLSYTKAVTKPVKKRVSRSKNEWEIFGIRRLRRLLRIIAEVRAQFGAEFPAQYSSPMEGGVELKLVGKAEMARLNSQYRNQSGPTDVLSFSPPAAFLNQWRHQWSHSLQQPVCLGELVICLPILKQQAKRFRHSIAVELEVLLIHGLLHLLGLDHEASEVEAQEMATWEARILSQSLGQVSSMESRGLIHRGKSVIKSP